jgi:hypothetical protein
MRKLGTARYGHIDSFGKFEHGSTLALSRFSCIASSMALLKDEQKFKLGGCVGAHKVSISCANMSGNVWNNHALSRPKISNFRM